MELMGDGLIAFLAAVGVSTIALAADGDTAAPP